MRGKASIRAVRHRITMAARMSMSAGDALDHRLLADICARVGIQLGTLRRHFPSDDELFDAVHVSLVEECASRLQAGVSALGSLEGDTKYLMAAKSLADAWPIERGGMAIRATRRAGALAGGVDGALLLASERRFVEQLLGTLSELIALLGRTFDPSPSLAVRVIVDTFERSFEAWILEGHPESQFSESPYIRRTLPTLLEKLSTPI